MQIISGSISALTAPARAIPLRVHTAPRRRFTFAFHAFTDFSSR